MNSIRNFYSRIWREYADPQAHPMVSRAIKTQTEALGRRLSRERPRRILDLGCGPSPAAKPQWAPVVVYADIVHPMLIDLKRKLGGRVVCLDAAALPFRADSFGLVWCSLLVDHIAEVRPWIRELIRILEPGGTLALACWDQSLLPAESYPGGSMRYPTASGEVLSAPVYFNWESTKNILREFDSGVHVESYSIVEDAYVLEIAWSRP